MTDFAAALSALRDLEKQARQHQTVLRLADTLTQGTGLAQELKDLTAAVAKAKAELTEVEKEREGLKGEIKKMIDLAKQEAAGIKARAQETAETKLAQADAQIRAAEQSLAELQTAHDLRAHAHRNTMAEMEADIARLRSEHDQLSAAHAGVKEKLRSLVA